MTILFDPSRNVKATTPRTFARGLVRSLPSHKADHTAADAAWWAEQTSAAENRHFDTLAADALAQSFVDAGLSY